MSFSYIGTGGIFIDGSTYSFNESDVLILFSGGVGNNNPLQSIGGDASYIPVNQSLFNNITASESFNGYADYRCIYLYNNNPVYSLLKTQIYVTNKPYNGSNIELGIYSQLEVQNVMVNGSCSGGNFVLSYNSSNFTISYNADPAVWASNFQNSIRTIDGLGDTVVDYGVGSNIVIFIVNFQTNRFQNILSLYSNSLTGSPGIIISKIFNGGPINLPVEKLLSDLSSPPNISFQQAYDEPIFIGDLQIGDLVPIWIKRTISPASSPFVGDGFSLIIVGDPND